MGHTCYPYEGGDVAWLGDRDPDSLFPNLTFEDPEGAVASVIAERWPEVRSGAGRAGLYPDALHPEGRLAIGEMPFVSSSSGGVPVDEARSCGSVGLLLLHVMETRHLSTITRSGRHGPCKLLVLRRRIRLSIWCRTEWRHAGRHQNELRRYGIPGSNDRHPPLRCLCLDACSDLIPRWIRLGDE